MKKIIIITAVCILLAITTLAVLKFFEIGPYSNVSNDNIDKTNIPMKAIFFDMKPLIIPILNKNELAANLNINIKLETRIPKLKEEFRGTLREKRDEKVATETEKIEKLLPVIEDLFITDLVAFVPRYFAKYDRIDDIILEERLAIIAARKLGNQIVYGVKTESKVIPPSD